MDLDVNQEATEINSDHEHEIGNHHQSIVPPPRRQYQWYLEMVIYALFVLSGQSAATLLGRLYYEKGGKSKWMATLVQSAGFPILLPLLYISVTKNHTANSTNAPSTLVIVSVYGLLGLFLAAGTILFVIGLLYLPVSTFSLITSTQVGFNAIFSRYLNSQKFTPFIINSIVLLTTSSSLLVFHNDSGESSKASKGKYAIGFLCTVGAATGYALILSISQLFFRKILKKQTIRDVLDVTIYESLVATCVILVGLFASGEWKSLKTEMEEFELGKSSYVMTLVWTALAWQVFSIGIVGLIFKGSALFANEISTLTLPIVPVLAVIFSMTR
ncbi:unnamed protein product [Ilex paraguariensis]|uniref:Probable purine permease n=1 Tax=Ilex paraguariensis TaxID=185542 RepID=A0ABC8TM26_9AQUA